MPALQIKVPGDASTLDSLSGRWGTEGLSNTPDLYLSILWKRKKGGGRAGQRRRSQKSQRRIVGPSRGFCEHLLGKPISPGKEIDESFMIIFVLYSLKDPPLLLSNLNWLGSLHSPLQPLLLPLASEIPQASLHE
jgi:hypothetical protein